MISMEVKEFLGRAEVLEKKIRFMMDKIKSFRESAYVKGVNYNLTVVSSLGGDSNMVNTIAKITEYEGKLEKLLEKQKNTIDEIEEVLFQLTDDTNREFANRRYLMYQPLEGYYEKKTGRYVRGISDSMELSPRQLYRIQNNTLKEIEDILSK